MAKTSKKNWTKHFAEFLVDYIEYERQDKLRLDDIDADTYSKAIESYESQNNCTIIFVKDKI